MTMMTQVTQKFLRILVISLTKSDITVGERIRTEPMTAIELLAELRQRGIRITAQGDHLYLDAPRGAVTSELREALITSKEELLRLLIQPSTTTARDPESEAFVNTHGEGAPNAAVKVWSDMLGEAVWVVADDMPRTEWPAGSPVYTHQEVKILLRVGPDTLKWVHLVKELFGVRVIDGKVPKEEDAS
jgi:hypothetical protein